MTYHRNNLYRRRFAASRWLVGTITVILAIFLFAGPLLARLFGGPFVVLAKPLWATRDAVVGSLSNLSALVSSKAALENENRALQRELTSAQALVLDRATIESEATALRVELGLRSSEDPFVVAKVISNPLTSPYDVVVVDLGSRTSEPAVAVGDLVTYHNVIALGSVIAVSPTSAKISLFSTGGTELPVVLGPGRVPALATGRGAGNFLIQLPRTIPVATDNVMFMTAPQHDYILGKVGAITKTPSDTLQSILVRSPLNTNDLSYVEIHSR